MDRIFRFGEKFITPTKSFYVIKDFSHFEYKEEAKAMFDPEEGISLEDATSELLLLDKCIVQVGDEHATSLH